ncbi:uncharacterized protein [Salminus brasiliensis]|uniref:uncharacterized protein isoform X4 n=1 Tax=Salminus brasiliensis TaxID=930266 RepID=UPI003B832C47
MFDVLHVNLPERMAVECGKNISSEMSLQEDQDEIQSGPAERPNSPRSSCVSFKSDQSMVEPLTLKEGSAPPESGHAEMPNPPGSSCMSYKSDHSMGEPLNLKEESAPPESRTKARSSSRGSSFVSFKSDQSIKEPPTFQEGLASQERESAATSAKLQKKIKDQLKDIFHELEKRICEFIKQELEIYRKHLTERTTKTHDNVKKDTWTLKQGALNMTQYFLKKMEHDDLAEALQDEMTGIQQHALKSKLSEKCRHVCEGIAQQGESTLLNKIYTDLYITEGGAGQVNKEHEVRLIQKNNVNRDASQLQQEAQIECKNMFDLLPGQEKNIRTVLTQGVAGIGKSICVQKFILDWAAGEGHQDIQFIFPLPFRELNLKKGRQSLMDIICFFFPETEGLRLTDQNRIMFILDGLDECQHPLVFQKNESLNDVCKSAPLDVVLTNLIKGNLLPSALIWITTRPAAASRIPAEHVHRMTELRGFNNQQKEEYFRKRISDENLATKIIEHIKESRSLFIMCHIPVFCWISAKVLLRILEETESGETPKTLTEMYTCFLIFQAVQGNLKYSGKNVLDVPWDKEAILSLGKLSFQHLEESNLIFNIEDLEACGVDPSKISVYSGLCTQETVRFLGTVFSFVHLSIQEFLTAVFAYLSLRNDLKNVFDQQSTSVESKTTELTEFLKTAVDKALKSDHGHLDLFLRFLLGLSLESNEKLIRGLLTQSGSRSDCRKEIVEYIKLKFKDNLSPERSINLFYCLNELNDDSLVKDIQSHMSSGSLSEAKLSPAQWSALVFVLLTSKEKLEVFDLQKFIRSEECLNRLLPVVQEATTALLSECNLTERSCSALLQVLSSESSNLTLLDLSNNPIQDLGVELLSEGLRSPACKLETLRLSECNLTERSCSALLQVLSSESSNLTLLDLSNNPIQDLGVERLSEGLNNFNYKLETLGLSECNLTERSCSALLQVLSSESSNLTLLDLSNNPIQDLGVELLSEGLRSPACKLETLRLSECNLTERSCSALLQVLSSESSNLTLLDLSNNPIQDLGVELLSEGLRSPACKLETLSLSSCSITGKGYTYLASALESNSSSPLTELDLRGNDPGDTGVKKLTDLVKNPKWKLNKLGLLKSSAAEKLCDHLTEALGINPLLLTELDLSGRIQGDSEMKKLSDLLEDSHCRTQILKLNNSRITEEGCAALSAALSSNPSHLKELDLSGNKLGNPGVKQICNLLKILDCRLAKLNLSDCSVTQEGYKHLASALKSNPSSHLTELDLRGNDPGDTGVKKLTDLVEDSNCKLKTLRLLKTAAAEEAWTSLSSALRINILLLTELKLSRNPAGPSGDSRVKLLCAVLQDTHCKLRRLWINDDDLTEESCSALATVLTSSTLTELDLSSNNLQDSGVKELCSGLKDPLCKLKKLSLSFCRITEGGYAALASALESSSSALTELDLRGNDPGDTGVKQLTGLFMNTKKKLRLLKSNAAEEAYTYFKQKLGKDPLLQTELDLSQTEPKKIRVDQLSALLEDPHCRLQKLTMYKSSSITERDCADLISALTVNPSHLRELDLKENKLDQAGLQKLCDLLKNSHCRLEKLSLRGCCLSGEGYEALASALKSNPSSVMTELDLRGNDPGETGVRLFTDLQNDPRSKLKTLRLLKSSAAEEVCDCLNKALGINPLLLTELDLSGRIQGDSEMKKLCDLLEDSHCRTQKLKLNNNSITEEGCATLSKALCSNYPHLKELDLSGNKLGNSGVKHVASLLRISDGKVEKLNISDCGLTEGGYAALASALKSNPSSSLKELDLRGNDPGDTGVKQLWDLKEDSKCNLNTLRVLKSSAAEKLCDPLTEALGINPLLQTELDLSGRIQGDSEMKKLSDLLEDSHCRTQKLKLNNSSVTEEGCAALSAALSSNPSHLKELDLSENKLGNPGVKQICNLLTNQCCKLQRLRLSFCSVTGEGYAALASALKSNGSSPLMELDLRGNDPGDAGVELIRYFDYLSKGSKKTLRLLKKDAADQAYTRLKQILQKNPLVQTELDLSKTDPKQIQVQQLSALLEDPHCRLQKLTMYKSSSITERDCADLISALTVNPSHLRELDLNENKLDQAGLQKLCDLLKNPHCRLKKLSLRCCCISEEGYAALASALKLNTSSPLMELDLRGNDPGDKGVKLIMDLEKDSQTTGRRIRLLKSSAAEKLCDHLTGALGTNPLLLRELDLSGRIQGDSEMKQLSDLLKDSHCRPEKIKLNNSSITEEGCAVLSAALSSNPSHLKELDLSENKLGNPGVKKICDLLKILDCRLAKLNLSDCSVTQEGYEDLASALKSNPSSHLTELDLRGNDPGDSGVKKLTDLVEDSNCKLKTLRLLKTAAAEEAWTSLSSALGINILLQTELKLSRNSAGPSGDSRVKLLCAVLQDTHCKLRRLRINDDDLTEESCSALATVLTSSTLTELDLSSNNLQDSGVKELCSGLKDPLCKLKKLSLSFCRITEGGYAALASALKSSSSALTELDLRGNDPGDTGVKQLTGLFVNTKKKLRLLKSDAAKEAYTYFKRKLGKDPLLQMELDLSKTEPKEIRVDQLSALLEDPHCRLQKLTMYKSSSITERDCADLISALTVNPSHLRELDLKENKLGQAGLQKLCDLLKNPHCRLEKLRLVQSLTEGGCADLASALYTNPSHIRELDLSLNKLGASGVKQLCRLVENQKCELQKLQLKKCSIEEDGCAALTSALSSNPSHLRELDLRENKLGKSVEQLSELMKKSGCSLRLDPSLLKWFTPLPSLPSWFWGNTDKPQHSANQEKPEEDDEVGEQDGAGQCNRTSEQTAGEQGGAGQCNRTSEQTAGERGGAGQCNRTSEQTAGERDGAGQCNRTSVQTAGERGGAGQCNRTSVQTAGERGGAGQCNRTSVQTAGERGGAGQCNRTSVQTAGERGGAGQCNRTSEQTAGERGGAGQCNRTSEQTAGERGGAGQCNWISVQTAGERGGAGQCNRTSVQTAGERGGAGQCNRTSVQTARERGGAGQCNRTSEQTAGERGGAGQCNWTSVQTAGERGGAGQGNWTSVQTAGEREGACQGNRTSVQTAGERDGAGQCNRTSVQTAGERDGAGQCNRTSEQTAGERGGAGQCNRISVQTAGERGGAGQGNRTSVQTAGERGGAGQCNRISVQTAGERDRAGQCNRTSEQTAGERGGAGQCNRTSVQTAGERGGAGQCNRTSEQTAGERGGAGQCNWTSVQTAGERGGAGQGNRTSVQTAGKREGAYQGNRTSGQTAGERDGVGQDEQNSLQTAGERDGAGQCNRTSGQTAGERDGAGQCNRTSVQTAGERGGAGQCNRTSVQTAGERGGAGQCNRTSVQTAGERDRAGQDEQNSEQTAGERDGAGQCNRTSVQTAGERGGAGQCNRTSVQTAGERDGAGQDEQNSEQTAGERDGAGQDEQNSGQTAGEREGAYQGNRTSGQTAGERDGAGQCNRTSVQTAGERDGAGQCNRTSEQTAGERGGAGQCNRTSEQTAGERDGSSCHKNKKKQQKKSS